MEVSNVTLTEPIQAVTESMVSHLNISRDISCSIKCSECNNKVTFVALQQALSKDAITLEPNDPIGYTPPHIEGDIEDE